MKIQVALVIVWLSEFYCHQYALKEQYYWGSPEFQFPNVSSKNVALSSGSYIPDNNAIYAMGAWKNIIFVSIFRLKLGVLSSFNYFLTDGTTKSPVLIPYPSFDANYISENPARPTVGLPSDSSIVCAAYFRIDKCDRLWVIDAGYIDFFDTRRVFSEPALVIFDLKTNTLIRRYTIPAEFVNSNTAFVNLDIDIKGSCDDTYAYIADLFRSIVVYSFNDDRSWQLTHNFLGSDPNAGNFFYEGINYHWNFGIVGITVGEHHRDGSKRVYLKPFTSTKTYYISNKVLQDEAYIGLNKYYDDVHLLGDRGRNGHIYEYAYDEKTNVLFDAQFPKARIGCWNTAKSYRNESFGVVFKTQPLFYPDDISVDRSRNLWVLSNNYPVFAYGPWSANVKNTRIFKAKVDDAIAGTVCQRKGHKSNKPHHNNYSKSD